ncbi:MAG TPA: ankyrin repeat domain-containing protein, partial [Candidatus Paceibacterota bacterium]
YRKPIDAELLRFLISKGASLGKSPQGGTPLRYAARAKLVDVVKLLLEAGADANDGGVECNGSDTATRCQWYTTALHEAVELSQENFILKAKSVEIAAMLIKHGAKPNVFSEGGRTPLFLASYSNNQEAATLLLKAGANPAYDAPANLRKRFYP